MKNLLFVTTHNMSYVGGGNFASRAIFDVFVNSNCSITAIIPEEIDEGFLSSYKVTFIKAKSKSKVERLKGIFRLEMHRYRKVFREYIKYNHNNIDFIVFDTSLLGDLVEITKVYNIDCVTIHHNVDSDYYMDDHSPFTLFGITPKLVDYVQKKAWKNSTYNFTLTEDDKVKLSTMFNRIKQPNSYNVGCFEYKGQNAALNSRLENNDSKEFNVVITGDLSMRQSIDGIMCFKNELLPTILNFEGLKVTIAGRNPVSSIKALEDEYDFVTILPNPKDMDEIVKVADLFLCPIRLGSGIKLRIMDGLRNNIPVLTHKNSIKGYDYFLNNDWFQYYEKTDDFASSFSKIYRWKSNLRLGNMEITKEYDKYFSFNAGYERIKEILPELF